ncbi:MAG TPA: aldo/keto reductase [Solirubrobacterales bacterium]|nr:aldo/keto reductase [Solirubrobacterales bacterium]
MSYLATPDRYEGKMQFRRCGRSGLDLPVLSLGYWHNFGDGRPFEVQRAIARRYGSAELDFGRLMREGFGATATRRSSRPRPAGTCGPAPTAKAAAILRDLGTPLLIHQPSYSMLNRWIETEGLLDTAAELGVGAIGFTALAQGLLTDRYLDGVPEDSRAARGGAGGGRPADGRRGRG